MELKQLIRKARSVIMFRFAYYRGDFVRRFGELKTD